MENGIHIREIEKDVYEVNGLVINTNEPNWGKELEWVEYRMLQDFRKAIKIVESNKKK